MTALCLDLEFESVARRDLHDWLGGASALLFSNPEDFLPFGRPERPWLDAIRRECSAADVRALAVKRDAGPPASSWVGRLYADSRLVRLREPSFAAADKLSFAARALRGELLTLQSRFIFCIDGCLQRRAVIKYSADRSIGSMPDIFAILGTLHSRQSIGKAA
jgi:hypothetical protein